MKLLLKRIICRLINRDRKIKIGFKTNIGMNSKFEGYNKINQGSTFSGSIGLYSYIGSNSIIKGKIGRFCSIGDRVYVLTGTHPTKDYVSTHPSFYSVKQQCGFTFQNKQIFNEFVYADKEKKYPIIIGNDVWIGSNVVILPSISIGDGAIVATGAVVTKDVSPYSVVGGVPAKEIRKRFSSEDINWLLSIKWWEKPIDWIKKYEKYFSDIKYFREVLDESL